MIKYIDHGTVENGLSRSIEVQCVDNRDFRTTWVWIDDNKYVEIDPLDLVRNAIENLPEDEQAPLLDALRTLEGNY